MRFLWDLASIAEDFKMQGIMAAVSIPMGPVPVVRHVTQNQQAATPAVVEYLRVIQADSNDYGTLRRLAVNTETTDAMVIRKLTETFASTLVLKLLNQTFLFRVQSVFVGVLLQVLPRMSSY